MSYYFPTIYYDPTLQHPILWNKERRRAEEKRLGDECFYVWKNKEYKQQCNKLKEQAQVANY